MPGTRSFDPRIQTEDIAFDADAMIACAGCGRLNPPNRLKCIYCAKDLAITSTASVKPVLRKLESWEHGYNLILREQMRQPNVREAAQFLSMELEVLASLLEAGVPMPVARVESEKEAAVIQERLGAFGIGCSIVSDDLLDANKPPVRLSGMQFVNDRCVVTDFNTAVRKEIVFADLVLIVPGVITSDRVDALEKKRRGGKSKLIDETATAADEMLLDIYTRQDKAGFRIHLTGFDFSCLDDDKGLLARENLRRLMVRLAEYAPNAILIDRYADIRHLLDHVWEVESRKDSHGLQRSGFGKVEFGSTVSSNNLAQFTKYSRLQWHLL